MAETSALGSRLDLGGQWIGYDHHRLIALAEELGATRFPMHTGSRPAVVDGHRRVSVASPSALLALGVLGGLAVAFRVGIGERRGAGTVDAWLRRVPSRRARRLLEVAAWVSTTADLDQLSMHALSEMVRHEGGLRTMMATSGGAQDSLLVEGIGTLVERLADELGPRVRLGEAVTSIERDDDGVTVRTATGAVRVARAVVTVPPPVAARIEHDPPLPPSRVALEQRTRMGSVYKAVAVYERPFWRQRGGGELLLLGRPGGAVFDSTAPGGPGHLCILVGGPEGRALDALDADARRAAVLGPLAPHLGAEVLEPASWHERSWHLDEHVGGGYLALPVLGTTDGFLPMPSTPVGHVHWAGSETAREHAGYLEGAIEAGERVAAEVADALAQAP